MQYLVDVFICSAGALLNCKTSDWKGLMHRVFIRFLIAFLLLATPAVLVADEAKKVTCQQTTERALKPFLDAVAKGEAALAYHTEETRKKIERLEKYIADLLASRAIFDAQRDKEMAKYDRNVAAAEKAISDIRKEISEHLAALRAALVDAPESMKHHHQVQIDNFQKRVNEDKITAYAPPLGFSNNKAKWRKYIADQKSKKSKRSAAYSTGDVAAYVPFLGYSPRWAGVLGLIAKNQDLLAHVRAREENFYLPMLGYSLTGPKVDNLLKDRRDKLAKARLEMAAGTFKIYVPTYGYTTDRNKVLADIGKARASLARVRAGWGDGSYKNYNPRVGYTVKKGDIDKWIRDTKAELSSYIASGNNAKAYTRTLGYTTTGVNILKRQLATEAAEARQKWARHFQSWQAGRDDKIEVLRKTLDKHETMLAKHREIWLADIEKREKDLGARLARALAETPCGGGSAEAALVDHLRDRLSKAAENDIERDCRKARYDDLVYITSDGKMHGDPRDGFLNALSDLGVGDGSGPPAPEPGVPLDQTVLMLKNYSDQLAALGDIIGDQSRVNSTIAKITALTGKLEDFETISKTDWRKFKKIRNAALREIRSSIDEVTEASLYFSGKGMDELLEAMGSRGLARHLSDAKYQAAVTKLRDVRRLANAVNTRQLPRMADLAADLARVTDANLDAARAMIKSVRTGDIRGSVGSMSKLDKGLLFLAVAAAAADASDRINSGQDPSEAVSRAGVNLAVELAISGIPITAAAHVATLIVFNGVSYMVDDPALSGALADFNIENVAKIVAQSALDEVAALGAAAGEHFAASEFDALDNSASPEKIREGIATAESRLNQATAGSTEVHDLMRARARLRQLLRAKDRAERIRDTQGRLNQLETACLVHLNSRDGTFSNSEMDVLLKEIGELEALLAILTKWDC